MGTGLLCVIGAACTSGASSPSDAGSPGAGGSSSGSSAAGTGGATSTGESSGTGGRPATGQYGFFRSDDGAGTNWTRINDDQHQFGWLQGNYIAGDESVFGRVYLTTGGRGYVYGQPN